ncbi:type I polyketide synthase [Dactylosporangium sp. CS-047395]|uniref:type I polyketide synthase n=1 Tax=Dactylosporangium sp. CS-047395 TaxID=3239936 RepID=UPI003D8DA228
MDQTPIAIVGMGCRLPGGVNTVDEFWGLLTAGRHVNSEVPADRWGEHAGDAAAEAIMRRTVRRGAFLDDVRGFDAEFFGVLPREAELMDPQQRLLLEVVWQALEHAGIAPDTLAGTDTGVYMGAVSDDYERRLLEDLPGIEAWTGICTQMCGLSNRVSYALDLRGPSLTIDTACSASLVALHTACRALAAGESGVAIVGGVNLIVGPGLTVMLEAAGALSPDGVCKSFDASANGYGRSEGVAVVVLKRLADAVRDGDRVHAVVTGSAVAQDGHTNGIMAPSEEAQSRVLRAAHAVAGIDPATIGYMEAHGTGTPVGDPIEARAISAVIGRRRAPGDPCLIGSVKSNIGHLEGGAGIASIIKAALVLQQGVIPPSLHCVTPNPDVDWEAGNVRVVTATTPYPAANGPRRAGVSGYGYGGTLAHVVLEQAPPTVAQPSVEREQAVLLPVSGSTEAALRANAGALADWLDGADAPLSAVAHTLSLRRAHLSHRAGVVGRDRAQLAARLREVAAGDAPAEGALGRPVDGAGAGPVFVFSGHGSQWVGMGRRLLDTDVTFTAVIDGLAPVFQAEIGCTPRAVLEGETLRAVDVIQPMIFAVQVALDAVWRRLGVRPAAVIGHSVGEIAAAVSAGVLALDDAARLVCRRSALLRAVAGNGAMYLAALPFADVEARLAGRDDVVAAIAAAPRWTVVSGELEAVEELAGAWVREGIVMRRVDSDVAFHSPQLDPLVPGMLEAAGSIAHARPSVPLYRTGHADPDTDPRTAPADDAQYWAAQLRSPVQFAGAVAAAVADGHRAFLEVSAHPIVTASIHETLFDAGVTDACVTGTLRRAADEPASLLAGLAVLHCHGVPVDFAALHPARDLADVPGYVWQHRPFWRAATRRGRSTAAPMREHTLLGRLTTVTGTTPLRMWTTELDFPSRPYPGRHAVHGVEIVPAAVLLHTFHRAAAADDSSTLVDIVLRTPISLSAARELQVSYQDEVLRLATRLAAADDDDQESWLTNTTARVRPGERPELPPLDVAGLRARCTRRLPSDHASTLLATLDVPSMGFPWTVTGLWASETHDLLAEVSAGDGVEGTWASVLDAALSLPTAVFRGTPVLRMPAEIEQIAVRGEPEPRVLVHVQLVQEPDVVDTVNVTVARPDGTVAVAITGLRFGVPDGALYTEDLEVADEEPVLAWRTLDAEQLGGFVLGEVRRHVAGEAKLDVDEVSLRKPLIEIGVDSVMTLAIRARLQRQFEQSLPASLLWEHPTVSAVADHLTGLLRTARDGDAA